MGPQDRVRRQLVQALTASLVTGGRALVPDGGKLVWGWFVALSDSRTYHMSGPNPIAFTEIEAFARLHRWPLAPHHLETIRALDAAWVAHAVAAADKGTRGGKGRAVPLHLQAPMSPELFDAVF